MFRKLFHTRSARILTGTVLAAAIAVPLYFLVERGNSPSPPGASTSSPPASSSNPNADRAHEFKALEQELAKKPEHPPILLRMAQISSELGKPADAIAYLQRLVKADPGNVDGSLELARLLYESHDVQGALSQTKKILEANPKQVDALYNAGAIYANLNDFAQARIYWNSAVASDGASDSGKRARESLGKIPR